MMRQFWAIKADHPDKLIFIRMGDFYEMFGDDAVRAAPIMGIALTSRSHGDSERIPLAGVPYHSLDRYLAKLLEHGEKVVIVEQTEDPKKAKGIVKREVVEIVTPGTATIDDPSISRVPTLAALFADSPRSTGIACLQLATGQFMVDQGDQETMLDRLRLYEPSEILIAESSRESEPVKYLQADLGASRLTALEDWQFDHQSATRDLSAHFGVGTLDGFGIGEIPRAVGAAGAIFRYLKENHRDKLQHISRLTRLDDDQYMSLDYNSTRNLELIRNLATGGEERTLLSVVNRCHTAAGTRLLQQALVRPFKTRLPIESRQQGVAELVKNRDLASKIREQTKLLPDLEKLTGRLGIGKLAPRQLAALAGALETAQKIASYLESAHSPHLINLARTLPSHQRAIAICKEALTEEPPLVTNKGGMIRSGYSKDLDALNQSIHDARVYIASLQQTERERTGISSLKVGYNQIFGYYIEITRANQHLVPEQYIRKQTLVNAERYVTIELKEKEELILAAEEKIFALEEQLYRDLCAIVSEKITDIMLTARLLAELDLVSALAEVAVTNGYVRPELFEDTRLDIVNGRHPVIESVLPAGSFIGNDIHLTVDSHRLLVLTGPNMSGKSTYLRQIGLIVILAQIGSFVPCDSAQIGLVDRVFTRVGALDNLARGQSTFLVEMVETANILHNATDRSLVLLDEVGRGTSTFDGLSVAWSVVEYLAEQIKSRTVFATHYHELTGMAALYPIIANYQVAVKRWEDRIVFLHKIVPGGCDDSYGIDVARLAGLPRQAIQRARQILKLLESGKFNQSEIGKGVYLQKVQPTLFERPESEVERRLRLLEIDKLTPLDAFDLLRKLHGEANT